MRWIQITLVVSLILLGAKTSEAQGGSRDDYWPTWRGPHANGVAPKGDPPIRWSETKNIKWKVKMPDKGESTPIIWGNKIFIQVAVPTKKEHVEEEKSTLVQDGSVPWQFSLLCLDRHTGRALWERTVREEVPHEGHHPSSSHSAFSPVTDGERIWASFGSRGLHCYDLDGNHHWSADLVQMRKLNGVGEGSSPVVAGDNVIVVQDHLGDSKITAFNKVTGQLSWEKDRDELSTWATPLSITVDGTLQVIVTAANFIRSYDVTTGDLVWKCGVHHAPHGATASPVAGFGKVFCTSGDHRSILVAVEFDRTGDLTNSDAVVWQDDERAPYVSTPLLYDDNIYFVKGTKASLSCYKADTGIPVYVDQKLEGLKNVYASAVGAAGRIYIADRDGNVLVIKHSDSFEVLAVNTLDDGFDASPVIVGDELYLKGENHLYCIAKPEPSA